MSCWLEHVTSASNREQTRRARSVAEVVGAYIDSLDENYDEGKGLLLFGAPGRGKSYLEAAVLLAADERYTKHFTTLSGVVRLTQQQFSLQNAWASGRDDDAYETWLGVQRKLNRFRNKIDLLVIDDVGKEYRTSSTYAETMFDDLLRHRYNRGLPTIMSSNIPLDEWTEVYGAPMYSFVHETSFFVSLDGLPDLRQL